MQFLNAPLAILTTLYVIPLNETLLGMVTTSCATLSAKKPSQDAVLSVVEMIEYCSFPSSKFGRIGQIAGFLKPTFSL